MMSRSGLYSLFFAITVGAFAPTEASSVPPAVNPASTPSPVTFALLADQHQQNNNITPVQKEGPLGSREQKRTPLANVLATAGTATAILVFVFIFMMCAKQMKEFLAKEREEEKKERRPEDKDKPKKKKPRTKPAPLTPEKRLQLEIRVIETRVGFEDEAMTQDEIKAEAEKVLEKTEKIFDGIKFAAGAEGRTIEELWERACREVEYARLKARAQRYGHKFKDYGEWLDDDWPEEWERREELRKELFPEN